MFSDVPLYSMSYNGWHNKQKLRCMVLKYHEINTHLDKRIRALERELKELKRARRARGKARERGYIAGKPTTGG